MIEYYIYLKFYHENIKKLSYNEKLLRYFETVFITKGIDTTKFGSSEKFYEQVKKFVLNG